MIQYYNPNVHPWKVFVLDRDGNEKMIRMHFGVEE